jgi:pterin-4a-carbinolamine dehydratase
MTTIFISYRRQDSGTAARRVAADFAARYGEANTFIDTDSIRIGADWARDIEAALETCKVVLAVVGPKWIHTHDEFGRRRIDNESDWVRNEVLRGLKTDKTIVPLLVQGAQTLTEAALPDALKDLCKVQSYQIADNFWARDINFLFEDLEKSGILRGDAGEKIVYPARRDESVALSNEEAATNIDPASGWSIVQSRRSVHGNTKHVSELTKTFQFQTFEDCIHFMSTTARHISFIDHHPRWENVWVNLIVS